MKTLIENGRLVTPQGVLDGGWLLLDGARISAVGTGKPDAAADATLDAQGCYVSPGFIDMHTHGGGGYDFMDGTAEAVEGAAKAHMRHGTTSICPTTVCCPDEEVFELFACYRQARRQMRGGPNLLGLHMEGPYFSPAQAGAQPSDYLKNPTPESYLPLLDAGGSDIARVSAAVELPGALALGDELAKRGILGAVGHSDALYEQVKAGLEHGYTHVTHLYSGMSSLRRVHSYRYLGVVESAYLLDGLTVEIIADGCHLPPELLRLIVKLIPLERISLITDSTRGAGLEGGGEILLGSRKNGQKAVIQDGVAFLPDFSAFAGSVCTTDRCVRTMTKLAGVSMADAVRMMSENPARVLGVADRKGRLAPGLDADVCVFDEDVNVQSVFVMGEKTV